MRPYDWIVWFLGAGVANNLATLSWLLCLIVLLGVGAWWLMRFIRRRKR